MKRYLNIPLLVLFLTLLQYCSKNQVITKYYLFALPESSPAVETEAADHPELPKLSSVEIRPFYTNKAYRDNRIALRTQSNQISYYFHHKWADNPSSAVRYFVWQKLQQSDLFEKCELQIVDEEAAYAVQATITSLERIAGDDEASAHLKGYLKFSDNRSDRIVVDHHFDRSIIIADASSMNQFALLISRILSEETDAFTEKIRSAVLK